MRPDAGDPPSPKQALHRQSSIAIQFVAAIWIVPMTTKLVLFSLAIFGFGMLLFRWMANRGVRRLKWLSDEGFSAAS